MRHNDLKAALHVFGLGERATLKEIKARYRELARQHHLPFKPCTRGPQSPMDVLNMTADKGALKVLLFLAEGFEDLEAVSVLDVCGWTEYREHIPKVRVVTTGIRPEVKGRFGLQIRPDLLLRDVRPGEYAALAIPGGFFSAGYGESHDPLLYEIARSIHGAGGTIATMCVGILPVAEAGLLEGKAATTYFLSRHHDHAERLRASGCTPAQGPIEVCDRIISCSGPAQSVEVALLLLESLIGPEAVREVRRFMAGME